MEIPFEVGLSTFQLRVPNTVMKLSSIVPLVFGVHQDTMLVCDSKMLYSEKEFRLPRLKA